MASQSNRGGASWSEYLRRPAVREGWQSVINGEPLDVNRFEHTQLQRQYESGRQMALESGMALPKATLRMSNEIRAVRAAIPAFQKLLVTEQANAAREARAAASLWMKLRHLNKARSEEHTSELQSH